MMLAGTPLRWFKARHCGIPSALALACASAVNPAWIGPAQAQAQAQAQEGPDDALDQAVSQPVVQAVPSMDTMNLNAALNRVAQNPRDANALIDAGNAALTLGDTDAAIGFYRRAGQVAPQDGRVKAGLAGAYVRNGDPFSAIPLFDAAEQAGASSTDMLSDRGLAFDLVGNGPKAQAYYRAALARGSNDEVLRRLALSLAISGDRRGAEAALSPLLVRQDKAAWRTKAFALAILGQTEEAVTLTQATMPPNLAAAMAPYLRYMRTLTPAQQASAANLGQFPRASEIGRVDPRMAIYAPPRPVALAVADTSQQGSGRGGRGRRGSDSQSSSTRTSALAQAASAASQPIRRPNSILPPFVPHRAPAMAVNTTVTRPAAVTPVADGKAGAAAIQPARAAIAAAPPPVASPALAQAAVASPVASPLPAAAAPAAPPPVSVAAAPQSATIVAAAPSAAPTSAPAPATVAVATVAAAPAPVPAPGFTSLGSGAARTEVAAFDLAHASPAASAAPSAVPVAAAPVVAAPPAVATPAVAPVVAVAAAPASVLTPEPAAVAAPVIAAPVTPPPAAPPVVPQPSRTQSLAEAFSEFAAPVGEATPAPGAVDIRRIRPLRELSPEMRAAQLAAKTPPPPSHPSRIWVQVATGRDRTALAGDWRRMARQSAELFRNRKANVTAWGQSNRLLAGPFETEAAAVTFVAQLRRADVPGAFVWTSPAGQVVDAVGGK
jgi:Flp pilus assembly protein TadD